MLTAMTRLENVLGVFRDGDELMRDELLVGEWLIKTFGCVQNKSKICNKSITSIGHYYPTSASSVGQ